MSRTFILSSQLLYQQGPPEISFNYTLDVSEPRRGGVFRAAAVSNRRTTGAVRGRNARPTLHWSVAGWTKCSKKCGGGNLDFMCNLVIFAVLFATLRYKRSVELCGMWIA